MKQLLALAAIGGLSWWIWKTVTAAPEITVVEKKYPTAIGPGLTGATNVAKIETVDPGDGEIYRRWPTNYDQPMGEFARNTW